MVHGNNAFKNASLSSAIKKGMPKIPDNKTVYILTSPPASKIEYSAYIVAAKIINATTGHIAFGQNLVSLIFHHPGNIQNHSIPNGFCQWLRHSFWRITI